MSEGLAVPGRRPGILPPDIWTEVVACLRWSESAGDAELLESAGRAVRELERWPWERPLAATLEFLGRVATARTGDGARQALVAIDGVLRGNSPTYRPGERLVRSLAACMTEEGLAPLAGRALWIAARRGSDLAPVLEVLSRDLPGTLTWGRRGASPDLAAHLERLGVVEDIPGGAYRERRHGKSDERVPGGPFPCGCCGQEYATVCIYHEGVQSNAGGDEEYEVLCTLCGLYTYGSRSWG